MAEAVSPQKRLLSQEHTEGVVKKSKADSPNSSLNSEYLQNKLSSVINQLNQDRENDQTVIDGSFIEIVNSSLMNSSRLHLFNYHSFSTALSYVTIIMYKIYSINIVHTLLSQELKTHRNSI